jgi:hypothetical protein
MRSLGIFVVLLFAVTTVTAQARRWMLEQPNETDLTGATLGYCNVYIQRDGLVRLTVYTQLPLWKHGVYHEVKLNSNGSLAEQDYTAESHKEQPKADALKQKPVPPNLFWKTCGAATKSLPSNFREALHGWPGPPVSKKKSKR